MKTALVTGAASGIGYELSVLLANDKYDLVLVDIDKLKLKAVKNFIQKKYSVSVTVLVKDLSKPNIAQEIFEDIDNIPIEVLINNAGFGLFGPFANTQWRREEEMLTVHITTTAQLSKLVLKSMMNRGCGKILNISSLAAFQPGPFMSVYYASKAFVLSFSQAIASELKDTGVTVTALCPGPTRTSFQDVVSHDTAKNKITFNMSCPKAVAKYGYGAMLKGKTVAIPGLFNRFLAFLPRLFPRDLATAVVRTMQLKNRLTH
ncbi:SDR family NAD(P)-dependent oxidoreductase [Confluentibacter flavum]|uniref:Short-chain dehydrogenase n=1 Tax=Confluentibacter flavum TaxID=1909700 RepID=A0A2N3HG20_9FLAO|nr:SDR family oxidoreductase [Confluentibacter flavum]PKQ43910.1 short-chain dehydrogenase [Confluentibacter flavum]